MPLTRRSTNGAGSAFDEPSGSTEAFERAVVLKVPGQAVDFLNDERADFGVLLEETEHPSEAGAACCFGGFVVAELDDDLESLALCVRAQERALCRNAEAFLRLFLAADARVRARWVHSRGSSFSSVTPTTTWADNRQEASKPHRANRELGR